MTQPRWRAPLAATALSLATVSLAAGCGSQRSQAAARPSPAPPPSLALSVTSSGPAWATLEMGGSASQHNNFWQLFVHPAPSAKWQLVTPPGMASNGGFILAAPSGHSLVTAFRPSQYITYSPLTSTADDGAHWTTGQVAGGLADVPDALAAGPGRGSLIALVHGTVELSRSGGSSWTRLATLHTLAASAAGRSCHLTGLTAVAFSPAGTPLAAGACARAGVTGIFAYTGTAWQAAGPSGSGVLAGQPVTVLRLTTTAGRETALFAVGSGPAATVVAAWSGTGSGGWTVSPALRTQGRHVLSASFGPGGPVGLVLSGNRGDTLTGAGGSWQRLPALPAGTQALVPGTGAQLEALAAHRSIMTVWARGPAPAGWARQQVINVPISYGSSS